MSKLFSVCLWGMCEKEQNDLEQRLKRICQEECEIRGQEILWHKKILEQKETELIESKGAFEYTMAEKENKIRDLQAIIQELKQDIDRAKKISKSRITADKKWYSKNSQPLKKDKETIPYKFNRIKKDSNRG